MHTIRYSKFPHAYCLYPIKPHKLRKLPKFTAVVVHPSGKHRKMFLPPISPETGRIAPWFFARFGYLAFLHPIAVFVRTPPRIQSL